MKKYLIYLIAFVIVPALVLIGVFVFEDQQYDFIYLSIALCSLLPFFLAFENRFPQAREIVLVAVLTAIAVASRLFRFHFNSIYHHCCIAFGKETLVGATAYIIYLVRTMDSLKVWMKFVGFIAECLSIMKKSSF